jgi:hypothetical protein
MDGGLYLAQFSEGTFPHFDTHNKYNIIFNQYLTQYSDTILSKQALHYNHKTALAMISPLMVSFWASSNWLHYTEPTRSLIRVPGGHRDVM